MASRPSSKNASRADHTSASAGPGGDGDRQASDESRADFIVELPPYAGAVDSLTSQSARMLTFVDRWLDEPAAAALVLEHRGAKRSVLDTVSWIAATSAATRGASDAGSDAQDSRPQWARPGTSLEDRPAGIEVAKRFGESIGQHVPSLAPGDSPRYVVLALAMRRRQLAQCELWAELPPSAAAAAHRERTAGLVALRAVAPLDGGPLLERAGAPAPSYAGAGEAGHALAPHPLAAHHPMASGGSAMMTEAMSTSIVRMLTRHIEQLMAGQHRTMDASLGAMAALNDKLLERTHQLEHERTQTLETQQALHRKWLQAEAERYRTEASAALETDIERAQKAQEEAKATAFEKALNLLDPAAKALTAKLHGADLMMRFLHTIPAELMSLIAPHLSEEQLQMLEEAGRLDDDMAEALKNTGGAGAVLNAFVGAPNAQHAAAAAAQPEPAAPSAESPLPADTAAPAAPSARPPAQPLPQPPSWAPAPEAQRRPDLVVAAPSRPAPSHAPSPPSAQRQVQRHSTALPRSSAEPCPPVQRSPSTSRYPAAQCVAGPPPLLGALTPRTATSPARANSSRPRAPQLPLEARTDAAAETATTTFVVRGALPSPASEAQGGPPSSLPPNEPPGRQNHAPSSRAAPTPDPDDSS